MMTSGQPFMGTVTRKRLERYDDDLLVMGKTVVLFNSVFEEVCDVTGARRYVIPNQRGLIAAVALTRLLHPLKLRGDELRFIRHALDISAKEMAGLLSVGHETISRWENNKEAIRPTNEKLIRIVAGHLLAPDARAIDFDPSTIAAMQIKPAVAEGKQPELRFQCVLMKQNHKKESHWDSMGVAA
jgi:DNA-binding transcriptional regulator YiaG